MSRRIITTQFQSTNNEVKIDTYFDRIIKYVPSEIIGAWIAVKGMVLGFSNKPKDMILWVAFIIGILFTALWIWKQTSEPGKPIAKTQILISVGAFIVLVFSLGEPFTQLSWYDPGYGSLSLIFYTLLIGVVIPNEY
jgi:hypothetical protein